MIRQHITWRTCRSLIAALALCLALILSCLPTLAAATTNKDAVAVIIGNKDYIGSVPDVDFAHNDAEAIKRFVIDVLGLKHMRVDMLEDLLTEDHIDAVVTERQGLTVINTESPFSDAAFACQQTIQFLAGVAGVYAMDAPITERE